MFLSLADLNLLPLYILNSAMGLCQDIKSHEIGVISMVRCTSC